MTPMKLDVLVAMLTYGGNGGVATILPEIAWWLIKLDRALQKDDRVGRVALQKFGDIPLTMERNRIVKTAIDGDFDVILMLDSDNIPDLYLNRRPWAKPFWESSFDFIYDRKQQGLPSVVAAPYCGPPPHPTNGGCENVYVFKAENNESGNLEMGFRFEAYDRTTASQMRGIQEIAAGPTGCIIYTTDALQLMPIGELTETQIMEQFQRGEIDMQRALQLLKMQSWFFYEFTDRHQTHKASTEDVTNTREIQLAGLHKHNKPIVFCNWDAWAGHMKPKCVGMPEPVKMEQINEVYREACANKLSTEEEIRDIDFTQEIHIYDDREPHPAFPENPIADAIAESPKVEIVPRMLWGHKVNSVGHVTPFRDLEVLKGLCRRQANKNPEHFMRVLEVGSWVGESAIALAKGFSERGGGTVYCVDTWQGSPSDWTSDLVEAIGERDLFWQHFMGNVQDFVDEDVINPLKGTSEEVARKLGDAGQADLDLVFIDANHDYEAVKRDIELWLPQIRANGIICGHDYCDAFPGVIQAVDEFCDLFGEEPNRLEGTSIWWVWKEDLLKEQNGDQSAPAESAEA